MKYREAVVADIEQMARVRISVTENVLPDPGLITYQDYETYLLQRGRGWVCENENTVVGFAIVDVTDPNIWALFIQPEFEGQGIGRKLQVLMLDWYFLQTSETVWLGMAPNSRAENFYRKSGWTEVGRRPNGEIRFEMPFHTWQNR